MINTAKTITRDLDTLWRAERFTNWLLKNGYCAQRVQVGAKKHRFDIGATPEEMAQIDTYLKALRNDRRR